MHLEPDTGSDETTLKRAFQILEVMIPLTGTVKIYYCRTPINLHRSFDGLPGTDGLTMS